VLFFTLEGSFLLRSG
jgi:hypothetical protein